MIFVIGNLRSGTSRIAESLHQDCNVHMGRAFMAQPVGPNQRPDWEEITLATRANLGEVTRAWMDEYAALRDKWLSEARKSMTIDIPTWGAKCCALMANIAAIPNDAFVIYANRPLPDAKSSAKRWMRFHRPEISVAINELQGQLAKHADEAKSRANLVIDYATSMDKVRKRLRDAIGVK